ncbi:protein FAM161B isoform X2 [Epinephelus moara]|uniref:protein FAM161B isoform X2 n=1 Tax=Epinephelus moara TaxID=300413 RepID=UPI00214E494D|nr:protein FAM161B isoform X2 [Epinephelus moara]
MPKLEKLLEDGLRSELMLQQQLKALSEALRQQLQETEKRQKEELERRIHQNSLLSIDRESGDRNELKYQAKDVGMRRSTSTPVLTSDKETLNHPRQSERLKLSSPALVSSKQKNCSVRTSKLIPSRAQPYQELCRQVSTQKTVRHENPTVSGSPKLRTAERTRKEKLGFLDERPSFKPKIIHQVPDFSRLHKTLQTEALKKTQSKDRIKCKPFSLRTSALPARRSRTGPENSQVPKISNLSRSKSLGALTSLSADTLPTYITDAARKRCVAIRKSMEIRDSKNQESADWLRKYQMRSQAMKKTVTLHAKLLDPHSSLKEVYNDKLQNHREADQQRMREYMRELRSMKARVSERPYLFEQVKQRNAKAHAEQTYRNKLKKAGLEEQFVEENGEAVEGTSASSRSEEDIDENRSTENDIPSREENVDDGEKIEDVEEKSVKSKGEEMP